MEKKELSIEELKQIADTSLLVGKTMLESGAEIYSVEETLSRLAQTFGCDKVNLSVLPQTIAMTLVSGNEFRTKMVHIGTLKPDMQRLSEIYKLTKNVCSACSPVDVLKQTKALISQNHQFSGYQKVFAAALACASFAALFKGTAAEFATAFIATFLAASLKKTLDAKEFNPLLSITLASLLATVCVGLFSSLGVLEDTNIALASSVLFLVPGVQLINTFEDIIKGHYLSGLARGLHGLLISFAIVFGIALGLKLLGSSV